LIPSPILKALSTIRRHQVAHLLMGGQACVLYGAAEFSGELAATKKLATVVLGRALRNEQGKESAFAATRHHLSPMIASCGSAAFCF
jgi:hypothetical protein